MKSVLLSAFSRSLARRAGVKRLRRTGRVPAVIYGRNTQPQNLEIGGKAFEDLVHHSATENLLVDLSIEADARPKRLALVKEIQHHPLSGQVLHVDFHEVSETETVTVMVSVEAAGEAAGVKTGGGVLEHVLFKLKVRALPKDLPEVIEVDVSGLEIGQSIHLGDIQPAAGVEILGDKALSVFAVAAPLTEEQVAAAEAETTTTLGDVEMIKEKKEEGAEGAAAAKGAEKSPAPKAGEKTAEKAADKSADKKK